MNIAISNWGWPQYAYMTLALLSLIGHMVLHDQPRKPWNGYVGATNFLLAFVLLTAGGFFA